MVLGSPIHKEQILGSLEKLLEMQWEYLQEVMARGQAREYLEEVSMASRYLARGECREVDESKRPRKARWGFVIQGNNSCNGIDSRAKGDLL